MLKEEFEQRWVRKSLRETISAVDERRGKLEGSMENVKEALDGVEDRIDNWKEQSKDYVKMSLDSTMDKIGRPDRLDQKLVGVSVQRVALHLLDRELVRIN
ncbi:hypothetical protein J1N35_022434 [Gossypium stocksii]|uniref:Uncharacterized protein n=1 Tax=Gossypium stocksii TaxID=47602 RepID=A0A9D4A295_9ROSI|nr:hypothetical protein J1N35_022434 [Gossypium stocksii]